MRAIPYGQGVRIDSSNQRRVIVPATTDPVTRRRLLQAAGPCRAAPPLEPLAPPYAWDDTRRSAVRATREAAPGEGEIELAIDGCHLRVDGRTGRAIAVDGSVLSPLVRLREGDTAVIRVTNHLKEISSIHWHGVLVSPEMDRVPGVSFQSINPSETVTYRFPVRQSGTYWAHSHSGSQDST